MKKILVPTDFSETANNAFKYAMDFTKKIQGSIIVMHTQLITERTDNPYIYFHPNMEKWEEEVQERYAEWKEELALEAPEVNSSFITTIGRVAPDIIRISKEEEIDFIIMGTDGAEGVGRLFGSNAADVVSMSHCPVLVIPHNYHSHEITNIVFATDYQEGDLEVLKQLASMAITFNANIHVLHVGHDPFSNYENKKFDWYKQTVAQEIPYDNIFFELLEHTDVQKALSDYIKYNKVDLLVMSMKKRNLFQRVFFHSQTKEMAFHTEIPLLAFQDVEIGVKKEVN